MSRYQLSLLPVLVGGVFFLSGTMEPNAAQPVNMVGHAAGNSLCPWAGSLQPVPQELKGAYAADLLNQAAAQFSTDKVAWLDMNFHQKVAYDDIGFELTGRCLQAPGDRFRYELKVKIGNDCSRKLAICDGTSLIDVVERPGKARDTKVIKLPALRRASDDPETVAAARANVLCGKAFAGLAPLLTSLRAGLIAPQLQMVRVDGKDYLEIRGKWVTDLDTNHQNTDEPRFRAQLRECRIYLEPSTLWPRCVEWWGSTTSDRPAQLLLQTIYELTSINEPLTAAQAANEFRFTP
jgi:hypothetical protein